MVAAAVKELNALLQQGSITLQIYAESLASIKTQKQRERSTPGPSSPWCYTEHPGRAHFRGSKKAIAESLTSTKPITCPTTTPKQEKKKESKKISNDQELIQSGPTSCPQNQKGRPLWRNLTLSQKDREQLLIINKRSWICLQATKRRMCLYSNRLHGWLEASWGAGRWIYQKGMAQTPEPLWRRFAPGSG